MKERTSGCRGFLLLNVAASLVYIFVARFERSTRPQPLPPYPDPRQRDQLCLVLGEQHHRTTPVRASDPQWLTIPERGLYTGMVIVGAVGTGKTSACMYPYVEQLLAYRASDPVRKVGGLVLEVKGDFCRHLRAILPFLRPIAHLIADPDVSEIMVNGSQRVFIEREGVLHSVEGVTLDERSLTVAVKNIARILGDDVSEEKPILDARLPDGSRVAAVFPPCSLGGTTLTIRKLQSRLWTCRELVRVGMITEGLVSLVRTALASRNNILISGGTGTGKTTLLNALATLLPESDRIVVIEDTAELTIAHPNPVRFEARRAQPDAPAITMRDLLRATLRHRPDRIIVGEVRGGEAFDLLQTLNTGHSGSLSTIHANSAEQALARFASCVLQSGVELPYTAIRRLISESVDLVVHLERRRGVRVVAEVVHVTGYDQERDAYDLHVLEDPAGAFPPTPR